MIEGLKSCPFCGSDGLVSQKNNLWTWIVECSNPNCPASYMLGNDYETEEEAIEAWNRRADYSDGYKGNGSAV